MKRRIVIWLSVFIFIFVISGAIFWTMYTDKGTRWVMETALRSLPIEVRIEKISGTLAKALQMKGVVVETEDWQINVENINISYQPLYIVTGSIAVKKLFIQDIVFKDKKPDVKEPFDFTWPKIPVFLSWIKVWIQHLEIDGFAYKDRDINLKILDRVSTNITWFFGSLALDNLKVHLPLGKVEGNIMACFDKPRLFTHITMKPDSKIPEMDSFVMTLNLKEGNDLEQMSGPFHVIAMYRQKKNIKAAGMLVMNRNSFKFEDLLISQEDRKGKLLARGEIDFSSGSPLMNADINFSDLDLARELKFETLLSGTVEVKSDFENYQCSYTLNNSVSSWKEAKLQGKMNINLDGLELFTVGGKILNGTIKGEAKASWADEDIVLSVFLQARELDPAKIIPEWQGKINLNSEGKLKWLKSEQPEGYVKVDVLNSVLRNKALTGNINAKWSHGLLNIVKLALYGDGFGISASGTVEERLNYLIRVSDLSGLLPGAEGRFAAEGWARWRKGQAGGVFKAEGSAISAFGTKIGSVNVETLLNDNNADLIKGKIRIRNITYGPVKLNFFDALLQGKVKAHDLLITAAGAEGKLRLSSNGGYIDGQWQGFIRSLSFQDSSFRPLNLQEPVAIKISPERIILNKLSISGSSKERFDMDMNISLNPLPGFVKIEWNEINMARGNFLLPKTAVAGRTSGVVDVRWTGKNIVQIYTLTKVDGVRIGGSVSVDATRGDAKINWTERGLVASFDVKTGTAGRVEGKFTSNEPVTMGLPETGNFETLWSSLNVDMIKPWLDPDFNLKGLLNGKIKGRMLSGNRIEVSGKTNLSQGGVIWNGEEGRIAIRIEKADMNLTWAEESVKGNLSILLLQRGQIKAEFQIPVPARFPVKVNPGGNIKVTASGNIQEKGLLAAMFPGMIGESQGQLSFDCVTGGIWSIPDFQGSIKLADVSAYLYPAGIKVEDITLEGQLKENFVNISSMKLKSGEGTMLGSAKIWVNNWKIDHYEGKIRGNRLQTVYLPELRILTSPDLTFHGDMNNFVLRGSVVIPELLIQRIMTEGTISASDDVFIIDLPEKKKKTKKIGFDMKVNVVLGKEVSINMEGINAQLEGEVLLKAQDIDRIVASGQIKIAKGYYKNHGISLDITRGGVVFTGGPVEYANLDILAVHKIKDIRRLNDVQVGVTITGTPRLPVVKLYSEPAMADTDILSYIVLGKPLAAGTDSNQAGLLLKAASALLEKDESSGLQERLMNLVGIDTFDVQSTGNQISSSQVSSIQPKGISGQAPVASGSGSASNSVVTVGKYLSPQLYIAFGRSLFTDDYIATARYSFLRNWEVEGSRKGTDSGIDLYYKIEFK